MSAIRAEGFKCTCVCIYVSVAGYMNEECMKARSSLRIEDKQKIAEKQC